MMNNIYVSCRAFAGGVTFGVWTVKELAENGLVLGALAAEWRRHALLFWSLILPHGIVELMAIFIAGGAGLMLGWALIAPGNLSRWDSLRKVARDAVLLVAGCAAMLVIAGCIEGFVTPSPLAAEVKLVFAGITAIGLLAYFSRAGRSAFRWTA